MDESDFLTVTCPFCNCSVMEFNEDVTYLNIHPCPHMLFSCYDDGWGHLSDIAIENLTAIGYELNDDEIEMIMPGSQLNKDDYHSPDHITDRITIPGAIKYASYQGPPSFYGTYIGFASVAEAQ